MKKCLMVLSIVLMAVFSAPVKAQTAPYPDELQMFLDTPLPPDYNYPGSNPPSFSCGDISDIRLEAQSMIDWAFDQALDSFVQYGDRSAEDDGWAEVNTDWENLLEQLQEDLWQLYVDWLKCRFQNVYPHYLFLGGWCDLIPAPFNCVIDWSNPAQKPSVTIPYTIPSFVDWSTVSITSCTFAELNNPTISEPIYPTNYIGCDETMGASPMDIWFIQHSKWFEEAAPCSTNVIPFDTTRQTPRDAWEDLWESPSLEELKRTFSPPFNRETYYPLLYNSVIACESEETAEIAAGMLNAFFDRVVEMYDQGKKCENTDRYGRPCIGDWDQSESIDGDDVIAYYSDWDNSVADADLDIDGDVDGDDMIAWFTAYDNGLCY